MFGQSLDLVDACGLTYCHVFPFSPRKGTPAARMPQLAKADVKARAARLRAKGEAALAAYLESQVGVSTTLLIERDGMGRTPEFAEVLFTPQGAEQGTLVAARITGTTGGQRLTGELV